MKFTFTHEDGENLVITSFDADFHYEVTQKYVDFLRGCGFILHYGDNEGFLDIQDCIETLPVEVIGDEDEEAEETD
jgi:hypothetical protein